MSSAARSALSITAYCRAGTGSMRLISTACRMSSAGTTTSSGSRSALPAPVIETPTIETPVIATAQVAVLCLGAAHHGDVDAVVHDRVARAGEQRLLEDTELVAGRASLAHRQLLGHEMGRVAVRPRALGHGDELRRGRADRVHRRRRLRLRRRGPSDGRRHPPRAGRRCAAGRPPRRPAQVCVRPFGPYDRRPR